MADDEVSPAMHAVLEYERGYREGVRARQGELQAELLDLMTVMPDHQTQQLIDYIQTLREIRQTKTPHG